MNTVTLNARTQSVEHAHQRLVEIVKELRKQHPRLELMLNYLGDLDYWQGTPGWKITSCCRRPSSWERPENWGTFHTRRLGEMADAADRDLAAWCAFLENEVHAGTVIACCWQSAPP